MISRYRTVPDAQACSTAGYEVCSKGCDTHPKLQHSVREEVHLLTWNLRCFCLTPCISWVWNCIANIWAENIDVSATSGKINSLWIFFWARLSFIWLKTNIYLSLCWGITVCYLLVVELLGTSQGENKKRVASLSWGKLCTGELESHFQDRHEGGAYLWSPLKWDLLVENAQNVQNDTKTVDTQTLEDWVAAWENLLFSFNFLVRKVKKKSLIWIWVLFYSGHTGKKNRFERTGKHPSKCSYFALRFSQNNLLLHLHSSKYLCLYDWTVILRESCLNVCEYMSNYLTIADDLEIKESLLKTNQLVNFT